jgi:rubrerythrin
MSESHWCQCENCTAERIRQVRYTAELQAENQRLREALTRISMMNDHNFRHGDLMNEAKAALAASAPASCGKCGGDMSGPCDDPQCPSGLFGD